VKASQSDSSSAPVGEVTRRARIIAMPIEPARRRVRERIIDTYDSVRI
jgi:hypothetical protein